jgi:tryptophan synthase alpha chain
MAADPARLATAFSAARGTTGLIPFVTAGYPSIEGSLELLLALDRPGVVALEIGIPFSDPIADGPEIQRASEWALRQGVGAEEVLGLVRRFRRSSARPVVLMTYANPVLRHGIESFARAAREAGVDGLIVSDLPPDESPQVWDALVPSGLDTIVLVAPTTDPGRLPRLLARARGFVYCLARTGVTGAGGGEAAGLPLRIAALRAHTPLPIAVGFGIAGAAGARALKGVADAVVVGAAFMRAVTEDPARGAVHRVQTLADELVTALA